MMMHVSAFEWAPPETNHLRDLSAPLEKHRSRLHLPALAAAVVSDREIIAAGVAGRRKTDDPTPVTLEDKFHIGSCTKSMTALLAVMLQEASKIKLSSTVGELAGDWSMKSAFQPITLKQLLHHLSGLAPNAPGPLWLRAFAAKGSAVEQREAFVKGVLSLDLQSEPGAKFVYSNLGYTLAGVLLEKAMNRPWEELVRAKIFEPLGMKSAGFGPPASDGKIDQPWGHVWEEEKPVPVPRSDNPIAIAPAGAVHCSILDLGRYAAFHLAAAQKKIPGKEQWADLLYTPPEGREYALGWVVVEREWARGKAFHHAGSNTMFYCMIWMAPQLNRAFVLATNVGDGQGKERTAALCDEVIGSLIREFLPN